MVKEVKDGMILTKENIGGELRYGLYLKVIHDNSSSVKMVNTIGITEVKVILIRIRSMNRQDLRLEVGTNEWINLTGFKRTNLKQYLYIDGSDAEKIIQKNIEFEINGRAKDGTTANFILEKNPILSFNEDPNAMQFPIAQMKNILAKVKPEEKAHLPFSRIYDKTYDKKVE